MGFNSGFKGLMSRIVFGEKVRFIILVMFSPLSCYFVCLKSNSFLSALFLPQCERQRFSPVQNKTRNYNSVLFRPVYFFITNWLTKDSAPKTLPTRLQMLTLDEPPYYHAGNLVAWQQSNLCRRTTGHFIITGRETSVMSPVFMTGQRTNEKYIAMTSLLYKQ